MSKLFCAVSAIILAVSASPAYFKYRRQVQSINSAGQHYLVVDEAIWRHARPDLNDLRMYAAEKEVPYKLLVETGGSETEQKQFRVLQPASTGGKTQFLLDMSDVDEYDRIHLTLATKNFIAHARVEGQDDPHGTSWALLGTTTLYDLSDEKLGSNSVLQIPLSAFKFLKVTVDSLVKPFDVKNGTAGATRAQKAVWRDVTSPSRLEQHGKETVITFDVPANTPVERLMLDIDPTQPNFCRQIQIRGSKDELYGSGQISRIHMLRNRQKVDVDRTSIELCGNCQGVLKAVIQNGDDPPLKITGTHVQQWERRIYFDSDAGQRPWVYYGDEKLGAPEYDYAKLFQKDARIEPVGLDPEVNNAAYVPRPDDRPWSEQHPGLLWVAILAAVVILGAVALRSLQTTAKPIS
ncbi:MAG TPA: DUF3999 family protein [Candidatus Dormibacteraeota bacterium]|nr:DUF3999 family protein [Candidatus Dormibacteraeota bacterium]